MNQDERKTAVRRMMLLIAAAAVIIGLYGFRLIFLQLVNGDSFTAQATNTTDYKFTVTAARGDIVDSKGERIASSTTGYSVVLNKLLMGDEDLDTMLQKIVGLLGKNGESWNDSLLIGQPDAAGHYEFTAASDNAAEQKALAAMKDNLGLQQYATADDVMEKLVEDYDLADFSLYWQRVLSGIHYEMQLQAFSNVNNFVMAENVSEATVATIKENSLSLPGVEIVETSTRSYEQGTVLPHVLGRVGKITAEKWKVTDENGQVTYPLKEKGYNMNDIIGISGLESAYEDELRGKDGVETITRNSDGVIVDTKITTVPEPGHTVQLTINSDFQRAVDKALANNIDMINRVYNTGDMKAAAGAAVVLDVKDGSVLAAANYPSFDQNLYATNYSEYSADPSLPLFNRALQGLYTPGSTFKPAVAVAALDSGLRVSHIAVKNRHDLPQLRGSKPVQSDVGESYQQVRLYLDQGRQVLFSGTPCQVDGLYRYLGEHPERLITCDVACSGVGSPGVWEKFVRSMAYIKQQKPLSVDFRGKLNGESTRRFHVTFENGGQYDAPLLRSEVGRGLARGIFLRPACHTCGYTSTDRTGDLTLCDMTGGAITPEEKRLGVSLLLINTAKGAQMFDSLPLHRRRCGLAEAVAADRALRSPTPVSVDRSRFFDALEQEPFRQVCARFLSAMQPREAAGKPLKELLGNVRLPFGKRKQK